MTRDKEKRRNGLSLHNVCSPIDKLPRAKAAGKWVSDEERESGSVVKSFQDTRCNYNMNPATLFLAVDDERRDRGKWRDMSES